MNKQSSMQTHRPHPGQLSAPLRTPSPERTSLTEANEPCELDKTCHVSCPIAEVGARSLTADTLVSSASCQQRATQTTTPAGQSPLKGRSLLSGSEKSQDWGHQRA